MLKIYKSRKDFPKTFVINQKKLRNILGVFCAIEHVGSTAVPGVDGKGIIDILIGFDNEEQIKEAVVKLMDNGYFSGRSISSRTNRIFMASSEDDTTLGDIHLHLVMKDSKDFSDFIKVRDFLRQNPEEAKKYSELKYKIAKETGYDREEYKKKKSKFIEAILKTRG
jgi:GrpB-like predicted nucleotidyltransferase (UPF0157 family)